MCLKDVKGSVPDFFSGSGNCESSVPLLSLLEKETFVSKTNVHSACRNVKYFFQAFTVTSGLQAATYFHTL